MPASPFTCVGFPPSIDEGCTHIILGSMPGAASLRAQQYYAYPQNRFWRLMAYLLENSEPPEAYEARLRMLLRHRIALWDSIASCEREGSLDSAIRAVKPNDFTALLAHDKARAVLVERTRGMRGIVIVIRAECLHRGKSADTFRRANKPLLKRDDLTFHALPSTSAANARWRFDALAKAWKKALPLDE